MDTSLRREETNGRRPARIIALIALCLLCLPAISASVDEARFDAYVEKHANGWIDWQNGLIYGIGRGYLNKNGNNRPMSKGVGGVLASGNIVKLAAGLHLDDTRTLESLGRGKVTINLKAFVHDKEYKSTYVENGDDPYWEVVKVADMKGITGLTAKLLDHFNKEQDWQDLPVRNLEPRADLGDEDAPWLLIDARNLGNRPQPALFPKIKSAAGQEVYDVKQVEEAALINRGMMSYVTTTASAAELRSDARLVDRLLASAGLIVGVGEAQAKTEVRSLGIPVIAATPAMEPEVENARPGGRQKRGRYIVKNAKDVQGLAKTNLVISAEDAAELQAEDANSQILKKCRVVVVVSSPIGGIEGALPGDQLALLTPAR